MKILTIIGARPQIIKAAAISRAIKNKFSDQIKEIILHTGQHYDENMSAIFFNELSIPSPDYIFSLTGKSPDDQMTEMCEGIADTLSRENPDVILVYGDTNSTYAGAKIASQYRIPLVHVEAGLRSWNHEMPEERNRVYADSVSTLLFSPTITGSKNLVNEGFPENNNPPYHSKNPKIFHCGDVMLDNSLHFSFLADLQTNILQKYQLTVEGFILATVHRNTNTDHPEKLNAIFRALLKIAKEWKVVLPIHPRTKKMMQQLLEEDVKADMERQQNLIIVPPVSFLEMISLEKNCKLVITDSGGVQKEAFYFKKPCLVLREETEWVELVECGAAILAGNSDPEKIFSSYCRFINNPPGDFPSYYGDGDAASFVCEAILSYLS